MTRFDELEKMSAENDLAWYGVRQGCRNVIQNLHTTALQYFGVGQEKILVVPTLGEYNPSVKYTIEGALRVEEDSYFHIGFQFLFETESLVVPLKIKLLPQADLRTYEIVVGFHDKKYVVELLSLDQFELICRYVFEALQEDFRYSLKRWINHGELPGQAPYIFYHPHPSVGEASSADDWHEAELVPYGSPQRARQWLTTEEAAAVSGYDVEHVRRLIRQNKVSAIKRGRDWWISGKSFMSYLEAMRSSEDKRAGPKGPS